MITASHNPPQYNGIKFIPYHAGPALPQTTDSIEEELRLVEESGEVKSCNLEQAGSSLKRLSIKEDYLQHLLSLVDKKTLSQIDFKVGLDLMHGAGSGYLEEIFSRLGIEYTALHQKRDPLFGGTLPDPTAPRLKELKQLVKAEDQIRLGLALDGDADRFGVFDEEGSFFSPNNLLFFIYHYLLEERGLQGGVVRSVATTHLLDRVAEAAGFQVSETPVGFKYVGQRLRTGDFLMGGEESGGFSIRGHIPEKDGLLASLLSLELVGYWGESLSALRSRLWEQYGTLVSQRLDLEYSRGQREEITDRIKALEPASMAGIRVDRIDTLDGKKIILEDGSWALVRPSGTEPVVRIYVEAEEMKLVKSLQQEVQKSLQI